MSENRHNDNCRDANCKDRKGYTSKQENRLSRKLNEIYWDTEIKSHSEIYNETNEINTDNLKVACRCYYCSEPIFEKTKAFLDSNDFMFCSIECAIKANEIRPIQVENY